MSVRESLIVEPLIGISLATTILALSLFVVKMQ